MSGDARDFNNIEMELPSNFFPLQVKVPKEIHTILTETLRQHAPSYVIVKTGWPSLNW
jgi:hypothetical protein